MNSATCVAKYEDGDYQCACAPGYVGKHCEIGISYQFGIIDFFIVSLYYTLSSVISCVLHDLLYSPSHFISLGLHSLQIENNWMEIFRGLLNFDDPRSSCSLAVKG